MKAFGWAADSGGCYFYRIAEPLDSLADRGHDVAHATKMPQDWRDTADVIVGQRVCNPAPSGLWQQLCSEGRATTVFEIDDDLLNIDHSNTVAWRFFGQPHIREHLIANVRAASRVTASTEPLAELMRQFNDDVRVVPNAVPDWLLTHERVRRDEVTIGWCGSPTHEMDFAEIRDPLKQFLSRNPQMRFHCIGSDYASWMRLPADQCRFTPWIADVEDCFRAYDFDIGIAPLRAHTFNRSKSHIKVLECAAMGIPVVASDVYPYTNFVRHGETGFLVKRDHEWGRYLRELAGDEAMRAEMGAKARQQAAEWTISRIAPLWEEALTP